MDLLEEELIELINNKLPSNSRVRALALRQTLIEMVLKLNKEIQDSAGGPTVYDKHFTYTQNLPSAIWIINHNLNKHPSVSIVDSGGNEVEGEVLYVNENQTVLLFNGAFSGKAYLN